MLLNLFDGHPDCCVYPTDLSLMYAYYPSWPEANHSDIELAARIDRVVFGSLQRLGVKHELADVLDVAAMRDHFFDKINSADLRDVSALIVQLASTYRAVTAQSATVRPVFIFKETSVEIYARQLAEQIADTKFVQLVRDPRDNLGALLAGVANYYSKFGEDQNLILASLIHRTGLGLSLVEANKSVLGSDRFLDVRFEDLATQPEGTMAILEDFLGISRDPNPPRPTVMGRSTVGNNFDNVEMSKVSAEHIGDWPRRIPSSAAKVIEHHLGDVMSSYGYARTFDKDDAARAAADFYKWTNYAFYFRDSFADRE